MITSFFLVRSVRLTLAGIAGLVVLLVIFGASSQLATVLLVGLWGLVVGGMSVGWSTWLAKTYPDHAEAGAASCRPHPRLHDGGAMIGGSLIDVVGPVAPILAAIALLTAGAAHTALALRSRDSSPG